MDLSVAVLAVGVKADFESEGEENPESETKEEGGKKQAAADEAAEPEDEDDAGGASLSTAAAACRAATCEEEQDNAYNAFVEQHSSQMQKLRLASATYPSFYQPSPQGSKN